MLRAICRCEDGVEEDTVLSPPTKNDIMKMKGRMNVATPEIQEQDYQWFLDNYDNLYKKYGEAYLAIKEGKVIGTFSSYAEAVQQTEKTEKPGSFIVQYCNGDESGYTAYIAPVISVGA